MCSFTVLCDNVMIKTISSKRNFENNWTKNVKKWLMSLSSLSSLCFPLIKFQRQKPLPTFHVTPSTLVPRQVPQFRCHLWERAHQLVPHISRLFVLGAEPERRGSALGSSLAFFQVSLFSGSVPLLWRVTPGLVCALRAAPRVLAGPWVLLSPGAAAACSGCRLCMAGD